MRQERTIQASLLDLFAGHEIGRELKAMSRWLEEHPALVAVVGQDLRRRGARETGRQGLPAEILGRTWDRQLRESQLPWVRNSALAGVGWSWTPRVPRTDRP